jgi:transposase
MSRKAPVYNPEQEKFILDSYGNMTPTEIAKKMGVSATSIYAYMKANDLAPYRPEQGAKAYSHPFRKANRRLEAIVIARKIENRKANPR